MDYGCRMKKLVFFAPTYISTKEHSLDCFHVGSNLLTRHEFRWGLNFGKSAWVRNIVNISSNVKGKFPFYSISRPL